MAEATERRFDLNIEKILNLFMFMNIFIVTVNILVYLAFCLVFCNKFRHLIPPVAIKIQMFNRSYACEVELGKNIRPL